MLVDYRIYETLYVLSGLLYISSIFAIGKSKWFGRIWGSSVILLSIVGTFNLIDWIWS